jgi:hypothetical protein
MATQRRDLDKVQVRSAGSTPAEEINPEGMRRIRDEPARTHFGFGYRFAPEQRS